MDSKWSNVFWIRSSLSWWIRIVDSSNRFELKVSFESIRSIANYLVRLDSNESFYADGVEARESCWSRGNGSSMDSNCFLANGFEHRRNLWIRTKGALLHLLSTISRAYELGLTWNLDRWFPRLCLTRLINCSPNWTRTKSIDIRSDPHV